MHTVSSLLESAARGRPASRLVWDNGLIRTYPDLLLASRRCAGALTKLGVGKGDRVAFWLPNSWAYLDFMLAAMQLGAIAVAVNTRFRAAEVGAIIGHTRPKVLVMSPDFRGIPFRETLAEVDALKLASVETILVCDGAVEADAFLPGRRTVTYEWALVQDESTASPEPDDDCAIFTTSGTTSGPKFALHKHRSIAGHAIDAAKAFCYDDCDAQLLHALPFCGIFGFSQLTATLAAGAASVFMTIFDAPAAAGLMKQHGVTYTSGTDDMLKRMLDAAKQEIPFPGLRECVYAGFNPTLSSFPETAEQQGMRLLGCFGMSEIHSFFSRQSSDLPVEQRKRPGGVPVTRSAVVRVRDKESGELLPAGVVGELEVSSPNLFSEYYGQPEATKAAFAEDGFFRTGDLGRTLEDGRYEFLGRYGDFMRLAGFLVNPLEIELELQAVRGVETAVVVEAPGIAGTRAVAFIKMQPQTVWAEDRLRRHCVSRLANFKVPALFVPVESFPTAAGPNGDKVQRVKLKATAAALMAEVTLASSRKILADKTNV